MKLSILNAANRIRGILLRATVGTHDNAEVAAESGRLRPVPPDEGELEPRFLRCFEADHLS
jgi:hypothetical protein